MEFVKATTDDLPEILELQHLAFESVARKLKNPDIPPMTQDLESLTEEFNRGVFIKVVDDEGNIIGSSRGFDEGDHVVIRKLVVHPSYRNQGIGTKLIYLMEKELPSKKYIAFTSSRSVSNLALLETLGYSIFKKEKLDDNLILTYLEKNVE